MENNGENNGQLNVSKPPELQLTTTPMLVPIKTFSLSFISCYCLDCAEVQSQCWKLFILVMADYDLPSSQPFTRANSSHATQHHDYDYHLQEVENCKPETVNCSRGSKRENRLESANSRLGLWYLFPIADTDSDNLAILYRISFFTTCNRVNIHKKRTFLCFKDMIFKSLDINDIDITYMDRTNLLLVLEC